MQKTIQIISFSKQKNQVKQDHHEEIDKNFIQALKKLNMPYNTASLNYINDKFNNMKLEDTSQEKSLIYQEHTYFSVM